MATLATSLGSQLEMVPLQEPLGSAGYPSSVGVQRHQLWDPYVHPVSIKIYPSSSESVLLSLESRVQGCLQLEHVPIRFTCLGIFLDPKSYSK